MINLIHDYVVDVNQYNYILMIDRHRQDKKGKPVYETLSYHGDLEGAIFAAKRDYVKKQLGEEPCVLDEAIRIINQVHEEFSDLLKEVLKNA